jgi:hypothetical protein
MTPDLKYGPGWGDVRYIVVDAITERGKTFLTAYSEATDGKFDCDIWEEDGLRGVESVRFDSPEPGDFTSPDFIMLKRQASLAGVIMRSYEEDLKDDEAA